MTETRAPYETAISGNNEPYWCPGRVAYWLERWEELRELATPSPPSLRYDGNLSQHTPGRRPSDPMRYVDIMADLERVWSRLPIWSIESNVVQQTMNGESLAAMASCWHVRFHEVQAAYTTACEQMARWLGWSG